MYCHIHSCHTHRCMCGSYNRPTDPNAILTRSQLIEATNEFKQELLNYSIDLKENIFDYVDTGLNPAEVANNFDRLQAQDAYIIRTLTKKIDELNNSTNLSLFKLRNSIESAKDDTDISVTPKFEGAISRTQADKNIETVSIKDFESIEAAINYAEKTDKAIEGAHETFEIAEVPNLANFKNAEFKVLTGSDYIHYATPDYYDIRKSKITNTINYTGWVQDKCFEYNGVIYAPYQMSTQHTSIGQRIVWSRSFDQGNTWTQPEIILDAASNEEWGWNCFSMGESGGRLYAVMEWRTNGDTTTTRFFLYSRPLDRTRKVSGGIRKGATDSEVTVTIENHGLFPNDHIYFSGTGVAGLSGRTQVLSVIDKNVFTVSAHSSLDGQVVDNSGKHFYCGVEFADNEWQRQEITEHTDINGVARITHIHSFSDVDGDSFIIGFGFGGGQGQDRQVGYFHVENIHGTSATLTKYRIPTQAETGSTEPCVVYNSSDDYVYLTTRNQHAGSTSYITRSPLKTNNWTTKSLPTRAIYCNMPLVVKDNKVYIFGTERGEGHFTGGGIDYVGGGVQLARTFIYELTDFNEDTWKVSVLTEDYHGGDTGNSSLGIGSAIYAFGKLMYFYGAESSDSQHLYTSNGRLYDNRDVFNGNGMQQDIMLLEITLDNKLPSTNFDLRAYDSKTLPIIRTEDNKRMFDAPIGFSYPIQSPILLEATNYSLIGIKSNTGMNDKYLTLSSSDAVSTLRGAHLSLYGADHSESASSAFLSCTSQFMIRTSLIRPYSHRETALGSNEARYTIGYLENLNVDRLKTFETNDEAKADGLVRGDFYHNSSGQVFVVV